VDITTITNRSLEILGDAAGTNYGQFIANTVDDAINDVLSRSGCGSRVDYMAVNASLSPNTAFYRPQPAGAPVDGSPSTYVLGYDLVTYKGRPLDMYNLEDMFEDWQTETATTPIGWVPAIWGEDVSAASAGPCIRIYPTPSADIGTDLLCRYRARHVALTGSDVPFLIPNHHHIAIVYNLVALAYRRNNEDADVRKADTYQGMYMDRIMQLRAETTQQRTSMGAFVPYRDL